ncbi:MAG TPA: Glu-tRNA(Gln) amidotransferase GatDE subunit D, partial [Euryarchaeota archaeon]|nr:Glu-tRNA(Gln) amidotransferase GatDE subunit D [Euryarchaeota archaeon]
MVNQSENFKGYRDPARTKLQELGIRVWSDVIMNTTQGTFEGIVLPRSETADEFHVVLKLKSGYNIGVRFDNIVSAKEVGYKQAVYKIPEGTFPTDPSKP